VSCEAKLRAMDEHTITNVVGIPHARVPIVTGTVVVASSEDLTPHKIDFDISVNNTLALHNTDLLRTYAQLDARFGCACSTPCGLCCSGGFPGCRRVRPLVYVIKHWAKRRSINSAPNGTLSSYGAVEVPFAVPVA
jgi:DNA polymerase sigma